MSKPMNFSRPNRPEEMSAAVRSISMSIRASRYGSMKASPVPSVRAPKQHATTHRILSSSPDSSPIRINRICLTAKKSLIPQFLKCSKKKSRKRVSGFSNVSSKHNSGLGENVTRWVHTVQRLQKRVWHPMSRRASKQQKDSSHMLVVEKTPALSDILDPELDTARLALSAAPKSNAMGEWPPTLSLNSTKLTDWIPIPRPRENSAQPESLPKSASAALQYLPSPSTLVTTTPQKQPTNAPSILIDLPTQIARFEFSHLTAHTTMRRLSPKTRVIVTCQNTLLAHKDMAHLARIWRRAVAGSPCAAIVKILDPLSRLSKAHARKLCADMWQGLQAYELWGERAKTARESGEGSMRAAWWEKFDTDVRELEAVVDIDDLRAQFKAVGVKHLKPAPLVKTRGPVAAKEPDTKQRLVAANTPAVVNKTIQMATARTSVPEQPYSNDDFLYPRTPPKVPRQRRASAPGGSLSKAQTAFECFISGDPAVQACVAGGDVDGNALRVMNRLGRRNQQRRMPLPDAWCGADMI